MKDELIRDLDTLGIQDEILWELNMKINKVTSEMVYKEAPGIIGGKSYATMSDGVINYTMIDTSKYKHLTYENEYTDLQRWNDNNKIKIARVSGDLENTYAFSRTPYPYTFDKISSPLGHLRECLQFYMLIEFHNNASLYFNYIRATEQYSISYYHAGGHSYMESIEEDALDMVEGIGGEPIGLFEALLKIVDINRII